MAFTPTKETFKGRVYKVTIGKDNNTVTIGGENCLPFHAFEGEIPNRPAIAYEIQDIEPTDWPEKVQEPYKGISNDPVKWAKYAQDELKAQIIALRLQGTHPDNVNRSPEDAMEIVKAVMSNINVPLIILGSNNVEKDAEVLVKCAEAAKSQSCIIGKAQEDNYKTIAAAAMANNHKLIAMSELDINLSKQLNIMLTQMGFDKERIIVDPMCSALGYGIEYTYTVMERIRLAALMQNDVTMQQPLVGDVGMYVWKIKEVIAGEDILPEWGSLAERGIAWEAQTACSLMMAGAELLIMRHPEAVKTVQAYIDELL
ncbi:acetyl-CoA decarbonylase/synthase complex subunit delta [Candidatus Magnetoovum chiemensis]|nr:acetyl-CoA decarbonylase/synthase complex subunit delta [Candidatus Magnetoovum chiemensis]